MRSITDFILVPSGGKMYTDNSSNGEFDFVLSSGIESHKNTNRIAEVVSIPMNYSGDIQPGDEVVVHHNVFRKYNDMRGKEKFSSGLLHDGMYSAEMVEVFAYRRNGSEWTSISPYIFTTPERTSFGTVSITNKEHESKGIKAGIKFFYDAISEYEFMIEGVKMYRVNIRNLCATE